MCELFIGDNARTRECSAIVWAPSWCGARVRELLIRAPYAQRQFAAGKARG